MSEEFDVPMAPQHPSGYPFNNAEWFDALRTEVNKEPAKAAPAGKPKVGLLRALGQVMVIYLVIVGGILVSVMTYKLISWALSHWLR